MHKKLLYLVLVLVFSPIITFGQANAIKAKKDSTWKYYKAEEGNFEVLFPQEPLFDKVAQTIKLLYDKRKFEVRFEFNNGVKNLQLSTSTLDDRVNKFTRKLKKFHKVVVDTSFETEILGLKAKETRFKYKELGTTTYVIYKVVRTYKYYYEFILKKEGEYLEEAQEHKFMESFRLIEDETISNNWHPFISKENGYRIDFPSYVKIANTKGYQLTYSKHKGVTFQIYYPEAIIDQELNNAKEILLDAHNKHEAELSKKIKTKVEYLDKNYKIHGYPALEARFSLYRAGITIKIIYRAVVTEDNLYQLQIISPYKYTDENTIHRFYDSFELIKKKK